MSFTIVSGPSAVQCPRQTNMVDVAESREMRRRAFVFRAIQFCIKLTAIVPVIIMFPFFELSLKFQLSHTAIAVSDLLSWNPVFYIFVKFQITAPVTYRYLVVDANIFHVTKTNTAIF